jgi:hypothetical protein
MKRIILLLFVILIASAFGTVHTVDLAGGGDYTTIHAAVSAAQAGDTILVMSGQYAFTAELGPVTIGKKLILIGSGYDPVDEGGTEIIDIPNSGIFTLSGSVNGTIIKGFRFKNNGYRMIYAESGSKNITIERNLFVCNYSGSTTWMLSFETSQNDTIRENIFTHTESSSYAGSAIYMVSCTNMYVNNNIFNGMYYAMYPHSSTGVKILNNIIANSPSNATWQLYIYGSSPDIFNNIFYNSYYAINIPSGSPYISNNGFYSVGSIGTEGLNATTEDPQFEAFTTSDFYNEEAVNSGDYDFHLSSGSSYINNGVIGQYYDADGSRNDLGIYGGPWPFNDDLGIPTIPNVISISVSPTNVSPSGTITFEAVGRIGDGSGKKTAKEKTVIIPKNQNEKRIAK